jgi:peptidoglycan/LPS O-acetylase OafA/YrhL
MILGMMWLVTEHQVTYWNQNLFWANPLSLVVILFGLMYAFGSTRARRLLPTLWLMLGGIAALGIVVNLIGFLYPPMYQDTSIPMAIAVPMIVGSLLSMNLERFRTKAAQ